MAINYIPNQPVFFGEQDSVCSLENKPFAQLVNFGDVTQFQLELGNCYNAESIIDNGSFTDTSEWTLGTGWTISGGVATHSPVGAGAMFQIPLTPGSYYNILVTVSGMTAGTLSLLSQDLFGPGTLSTPMSTNGSYSFWIPAGETGKLSFSASADFDGSIDDVFVYEINLDFIFGIYNVMDVLQTSINITDNPEYFTIDKETITVLIDWALIGISVKGCYYIGIVDPCEIEVEGLTPTLISNNFTLGNHPCTLQINACNDEDGHGFKFESSGFSPVVRLKAALTSPGYNSKKITDIDSRGKANVIFFSQRKSKKLKIDSVPEYIHDFLSKIGGYDRFYIDGIMYSCDDDEYQVLENDDEPNMGSVILEVSVKTQDIKNVNIGNTENDCMLSPEGIGVMIIENTFIIN